MNAPTQEDALTRDDPLTGPATLHERRIVRHQSGLGTSAVLDSIYDMGDGTLHLCIPADLTPDLGCAMESFVESLAEEVRRLDPEARALVLRWPHPRGDISGDPFRVVFGSASHANPDPQHSFIAENGEGRLELVKVTGISRYRSPRWLPLTMESVEKVVGLGVGELLVDANSLEGFVTSHISDWPSQRTSLVNAAQKTHLHLKDVASEWA